MYTVFVSTSTSFTSQLPDNVFSTFSASAEATTTGSSGGGNAVAIAVAVVLVVLFVIGAVICVVIFLVWYVSWYRESNDTNRMHAYIVYTCMYMYMYVWNTVNSGY